MSICYTTTSPHLAYARHGRGAETLLVVPGQVSHLEFDWETPATRAFHERLAATRRVVRYDKRGTGLSERPTEPDTYTLDTRVRDLAAVMDAIGIARCALFGWSEGGTIALAFAARYPERVSRLVMFGSFARALTAPDYPYGTDPERSAAITMLVRSEWGTGSRILANIFLPEVDDHLAAWFTQWLRVSLTPEAMVHATFLAEELGHWFTGKRSEQEALATYHERRDADGMTSYRQTVELSRDLRQLSVS